jgi:hypothetical protein
MLFAYIIILTILTAICALLGRHYFIDGPLMIFVPASITCVLGAVMSIEGGLITFAAIGVVLLSVVLQTSRSYQ